MLQVLASWSPVFMAMFSNSFVEKEQGKVVMHGKSVDDVRLLLNCIYPPNSHTVNSGYRACNHGFLYLDEQLMNMTCLW